jgi:hypothetical protein
VVCGRWSGPRRGQAKKPAGKGSVTAPPATCHFVVRTKCVRVAGGEEPLLPRHEWCFGTINQFVEVTIHQTHVIVADVVIYTTLSQGDAFPNLWRIRRCHTVTGAVAAIHLGDPMALGRGAPCQGLHSASYWTVLPCVPAYETDCDALACHCHRERNSLY